MKKTLFHISTPGLLIGACAALAGCSPFILLNAAAIGKGFSTTTAIAYGNLPRQKLDVYLPESISRRPFPVVVFFYGGGWEEGARVDYRLIGAALVSRGVMTIVANDRLYPEVVFPAFIEDAALAVKWAQRHAVDSGGDPKRLFIMGHSARAYIAAMLAINKQYLRAAGADPEEVAGWIGLSGPYDFLPLKSPTLRKIFSDPAPRATQPIDFATTQAPPAFLITGTTDATVSPGNSERLTTALKAAGRPVERRAYPGIGHERIDGGFSPPLARGVPVTDDVLRFIERSGLRDVSVMPRS